MKHDQTTTALGIELGSTRIKAVLIAPDATPLASGSYDWENELVDGLWTYSLDAVRLGLRTAYTNLAADYKEKYGEELTSPGAIGISAMEHGYLPFDIDGNLLCRFRTWRNTNTGRAAEALTELFGFNIPMRWSIAHLYQAILDNEEHVHKLAFLTTLSGYVHRLLTGQKVLGIGDASGMFPLDNRTHDYDTGMTEKFDAILTERGYGFRLGDILPKILEAGADAGHLTADGAQLLDPSGKLKAGIPLCPPEGDAGTGMVATNSIQPRTGNVSAGTSIFSMLVLERPLSRVYPEIDIIATPDGLPVAMAHGNTCTSDLDAWVRLFGQMIEAAGAKLDKPRLYDLFYQYALDGEPDCGGLINYNYFAGEPVAKVERGCPMLVRRPDSAFSFANLARAQVYSALSVLKLGMELLEDEKVELDRMLGHGGLFKTPVVGQKLLAAALNTPVAVMETAGEGGPWGMALLALYMLNNTSSLADFLDGIFKSAKLTVIEPDPTDVKGFDDYIKVYKQALDAERAAADVLAK
ncbi:MAG TPA: ATPase [Firmicutes bacterium]|nr:ATPase [Bacillota bacterium]